MCTGSGWAAFLRGLLSLTTQPRGPGPHGYLAGTKLEMMLTAERLSDSLRR